MSVPPATGVAEAFAAAARLHQSGDLEAAEAAYRGLLRDVPSYPPALCNLGAILVHRGEDGEAERCYRFALASDPTFADAAYNLGNLFRRQQRWDEAAEAFRDCLRNRPDNGNAHFNLGVVLVAQQRLADAAESLREAVRLEPAATDARLRLGDVLLRLGHSAEAVAEFRAFAQARPDDPRGAYNLGLALANDDKPSEAAAELHRALKLRADYPEAHNALGLALELLGRKDDAVHHYQAAVKLRPDFADAWSNQAVNLSEQGLPERAVECLRESLRHVADAPAIHSNLLLLLNYSSKLAPEQVRDEHTAWGEKFTTPVQPRPAALPPHDPERKLRIGYVSADYRAHTVAPFLETLIRHHDRERFEVFAYPSVTRSDDTTALLRGLADHWRPIAGVSDRDAADRVRADGIDVLVDLNGHTAGNRLILFAYRPAAVQLTLFGYPNTTGMAAMDFRVTDPVSDPEGATEHLSVESLLRLPEVPWVYAPPADAPPVGPLPAASRRPFTFGCLNNSAKISDACLDLWATLIQSAPGSKLTLMAGGSQAGTKRLHDRFMRAGILRERIRLLGRLPRAKYYEAYHDIDVALDPFPYNGGVTTADALWMGVPVLSVAGGSYVARQGVMQLFQFGLGDFVVESPAALVPVAKLWMGKRPELAAIRAGLREKLAASPLCDGPRYVRHLEAAVRDAWSRWAADCAAVTG